MKGLFLSSSGQMNILADGNNFRKGFIKDALVLRKELQASHPVSMFLFHNLAYGRVHAHPARLLTV